MKLPLGKISSKMQASGISSAVVVLLVYFSRKHGWDIGVEEATAMVALLSFAAGYLTEEKAFRPQQPTVGE